LARILLLHLGAGGDEKDLEDTSKRWEDAIREREMEAKGNGANVDWKTLS
jgi:hypothetical protein